MGEMIELRAADGHRLGAYRAGMQDAAAGLVVVQEIFGVNHHIRAVADRFAAQGYAVIAPALFDRAEPGVELGYDDAGRKRGMALRGQVPEDGTMADIAAAAEALGAAAKGIVGYCWGGTIAWWGATRTNTFKAASGWYGGGIAASREAKTHCSVQLHFGAEDHGIPLSDVEAIRAAQPSAEIYVYEGAGHGFGCDERASFDPGAYEQAQHRTLDFLARHLHQG
jgi:carboxymethylenebutenolidase